MAAHLGATIDIESKPATVQDPPKVHPKHHPIAPSAVELDQLTFCGRYTRPNTPDIHSPITPHHDTTGAQTPADYLAARPREDDAFGFAASWSHPKKNKWRVLCTCLIYFGNGMSDSAPGALIPYMEEHYHIGYAVTSLIFVTTAAGFISSAFVVDMILQKLGRGRTLMLAEVALLTAYAVIIATPPYPVVVAVYYFLGFGFAITLALNNVFVGTLVNSTVLLGFCQGAYGVGATIAPIIATAMVTKGLLWSRFYTVTLAIRAVCLVFDAWAFHGYEAETPTRLLTALERTASRQNAGEPTKKQLLLKAMRDRTTLVGALYTFAYQGAEVSISGWVISFLINYRGGDPAKVGYVTAGFWGGITLGRFTLCHAIGRLGEKRSLFVLGLGAVAFQLMVWFIPNVIGDAVAVSILGLLLGPLAPCSTVLFLRLLDPKLQTTGAGFISSAGSSGGAVVPFLTGLVAQASGTWVLHPICVGFFVIMLACWGFLPKEEKRDE